MSELNKKIDILKKLLNDCDAVLIGAGAGLSLAAGLDNKNLKFEECMKDFIDAYGVKDFYTGGFYPFPCPEEKWAYFARFFMAYKNYPSAKLYEDILKLVKNKDYFVITTNGDGCFEKSGFDTNKLFVCQGDMVNLQCSVPCHQKLYESSSLFEEMVAKTKDRKVPTELIPNCPKCGKRMEFHLRGGDDFVEDDYWNQQNDAYNNFLKKYENKNLLLLEFGVGFNTPVIIRFPFERKTMENKNWNLVRFNYDYSGITMKNGYQYTIINDWDSIKSLKMKNDFQNRFIPMSEDINEVIKRLL